MSSPSVRPIVISGPSGSGKSTLLKLLLAEFPNNFSFSVSYTTRNPRSGETNGKDYNFVTREEFQRMLADNELLEHAEFSGNCYGTSKQCVDKITKSGKICILDVEVNGVKNIKKTSLSARYIFIKPLSLEVLKSRLEGRGTETPESLQRRLDTVKEAMDYADAGNYDNVIVNDVKEKAYDDLKEALKDELKLVKTST